MSAEAHVYEPPESAVKNAHVSGMAAYRKLCDEAERDHEAYWARLARELISWRTPVQERPRREQGAVLPLVRRRHPERLLQLPRPQRRGRPGRQDGDHLRGRRRRGHPGQLQGAARAHLQTGQRAQGARHRQGRPDRHLHADVDRGRGRDAGLRPGRRDPLGGVRRLFRAEPARPHRRHRRGDGHHRRRADARRQGAAAEGDRRRGADRPEHGGARRHRLPTHRRQGRLRRAARQVAARAGREGAGELRAGMGARRASAVPALHLRARPASRRACSTRPAATCCTRR